MQRSPARSKTLSTYGSTSDGNREIPGWPEKSTTRDVSGSLRTQADDEPTGEVGQAYSTGEVLEQGQNSGGGEDGGKGLGPRELGTAKRVPDTEPERRAQCAGTSTGYSKKE